jgi:cytochrome c6
MVAFAIVAFQGAPFAYSQAPATQTPDTQTPAASDAATTFKSNCAMCHGADGTGSALGKRLQVPDLHSKDVQSLSSDDLVKVITNGKGKMPGFGSRLSSDQIQKLAAYVRTFETAK